VALGAVAALGSASPEAPLAAVLVAEWAEALAAAEAQGSVLAVAVAAWAYLEVLLEVATVDASVFRVVAAVAVACVPAWPAQRP